MNHTHLSLWWRFFRNGHFSRTSRVLLRLFGMHEDDVGTCTASSFLTRNQALKSVRQFNRLWSISRWTGAVTSHLVIVVTAIATNTTGVVIWKHTVPTPGGAAGVTGIVVCIFVRILGEGKEEKKMTFNFTQIHALLIKLENKMEEYRPSSVLRFPWTEKCKFITEMNPFTPKISFLIHLANL